MGGTVLATELVLLSAITHTGWNLAAGAAKSNKEVLAIASSVFLPLLSWFVVVVQSFFTKKSDHNYFQQMEEGWRFILLSGLARLTYFHLLAYSYTIGDVSFVYPIARGSSVAYVALFSRLVVPHYKLSAMGSLGAVGVVAGIGLMTAKGKELKCFTKSDQVAKTPTPTKACDIRSRDIEDGTAELVPTSSNSTGARQICVSLALSLTVGVFNAISSISDSVGVTFTDPCLFLAASTTVLFFVEVPLICASAERRSAAAHAMQTHAKYIVGIGASIGVTCTLVLYALQLADNAPYVVALRQTSIVCASVLGVLLLKEPTTWPKVMGVLLISAGVVVVDCADGRG
jgi:uncharacterized membrane protein